MFILAFHVFKHSKADRTAAPFEEVNVTLPKQYDAVTLCIVMLFTFF